MDRVPDVKCTWWRDHDKGFWNGNLWTAPDGVNTFFQLLLGYLLGAIWPCISDILFRSLSWLLFWWCCLHPQQLLSPPGDTEPLLESIRRDAAASAQGADHRPPLERPNHANPIARNRGPPAPPLPPQIEGRSHLRRSNRGVRSICISMLITACSIAWLLAGSFSTTIPVDESAPSAARTCGMWSLRDNIGRESESRDDLFQAQKEARAGQYGKECYVDASVLSPDHCNFFDSQSIPSHVQFNQKCPFQDPSFCTGNYTAAVFTTGIEGSDGFVDASTVGLNSPMRPKFRKTTTCVPLNMRQGFIRKLLPDSLHVDYQFEYYLGPVNDSASGYSANYTFKMFGDPYRWEIPAYVVIPFSSTPYPDYDFWLPVEGLSRAKDTYLTLMFISPCRIFYQEAFSDDIFGADGKCPNVPDRYCNPDPRARPLACVDYNELCTHDGKCDSMEKQHEDFGIEYEFVREAFQKSTTFKAIQFRRGAALLAQDVVRDYDSPKLNKDLNHWQDHDQWVLESWALFNTSLARMQYEALDIAVGLGHENANYEQDTPSWAQGKFCNRYKFKLPKGYTNINIIATFGLMLLIGFVACLSIETGSDFSDDLKWKDPKDANQQSQMREEDLRSKQRFHGTWMVFDSAIWCLFHPEKSWRSLQTQIQNQERPVSRLEDQGLTEDHVASEDQVPKPTASPRGSTSQAATSLASSQAWSIGSSGTTASTGNSQLTASQTIGAGQSPLSAAPQAQTSTPDAQVQGSSQASGTPQSAQSDHTTAFPQNTLPSPSPQTGRSQN